MMYLTWASFNNIRMLLMACMPIIIFYLIWLVNTSEGIRSEEGTLLDLVCWPDGNAIPVLIACGAVIAVVIEICRGTWKHFVGSRHWLSGPVAFILLDLFCFKLYGLYQLFKAGLPKREYDVTNGLFYYVWALIMVVIIFLAIIFYSGLQSTIIRAKIKGGITKAMLRYSSHLPSKVAIDRLQTRFHCCGRVDYHEWFYIPWYTTRNSQELKVLTDQQQVSDNVPYSCCSMDALYPCIHHGITQAATVYNYDPRKHLTIWQDGCEEKLIKEMMAVSWRFNAVMALIIIAMILQIIAVRYLQTAYKGGLHVGNRITCGAYLLRSQTDTEARKRRARTFQWVSARPERGLTSSDGSSDELLQPIDE